MDAERELKRLEAELGAIIAKLPQDLDPKSQYEVVAKARFQFFEERFAKDAAARKKVVKTILGGEDKDFAHVALCSIIDVMARHGDAEGLVDLLAKRCPDRVGIHTSIEVCLIILCREKLSNGTLVLCDAFKKSDDPVARKTIAAALRRGFEALGVSGDTDRRFVSTCRRWYGRHRREYAPNWNYADHLVRPFFPYDTEGVLKKRDDEAKNAFGEMLRKTKPEEEWKP